MNLIVTFNIYDSTGIWRVKSVLLIFTHIREVFQYSNLKNVYLHRFLG